MYNKRKIVLLLFRKNISVKVLNHVSNFKKGSIRADSDSISQLILMLLLLKKYWTQEFFTFIFLIVLKIYCYYMQAHKKLKFVPFNHKAFHCLVKLYKVHQGTSFLERKSETRFSRFCSSSRKKTLSHNPIVTLNDIVN